MLAYMSCKNQKILPKKQIPKHVFAPDFMPEIIECKVMLSKVTVQLRSILSGFSRFSLTLTRKLTDCFPSIIL